MSSVNKFVGYYDKDLGRSNQFETSWMGGGISDAEGLSMACKTIDVPGITLNDGVYDGRKFAVGYDLDSFSATFMLDAGGKVIRELYEWANRVYNQDTGKFGWKDDYGASLYILLNNREGSPYSMILIQNVFPVNISPISLSWDNEEIVELSVDFDFDMYQNIGT